MNPVTNNKPYLNHNRPKKKIKKINPSKLRYAQASMKDETRNGLPIPTLVENMKKEGYNPRYPIRVVRMSPAKDDSPGDNLVAYDTRRTNAARKAYRELEDFLVVAEVVDYKAPAEEEYRQLQHLTFENRKRSYF